jgi:ribosomal protein S18 acetylase RimI-like enzyme
MNFVVRDIDFSEYDTAQNLLAENGWAHRIGDIEDFRMLCENSQQVLVAVNGRQVIGFVRALTDRLSNGYISMLIVHPDFRKLGVGRALIQAVMAYGRPSVTWTLRAGREGASEFFAALGFKKSSEAMEIKRQSP